MNPFTSSIQTKHITKITSKFIPELSALIIIQEYFEKLKKLVATNSVATLQNCNTNTYSKFLW